MSVPFIKMHGLGNDFVILDARSTGFRPSPEQVRRIADRHRGVGCDQLIVLDRPTQAQARLAMRIFNADGGVAGACGNATRCVARLERETGAPDQFIIESDTTLLAATIHHESVAVDMGPARLESKDIPLADNRDTLAVDVGASFGLPSAVCVNMGNPHAVFFVKNAEDADVAGIGPQIENHPLFPARTNVEFVSVLSPGRLRMRVWERGSGITQACGTGACAALVAAARKGLCARKAEVILDGGSLVITWLDNGHVLMEGPASMSFRGVLSDELLESAS